MLHRDALVRALMPHGGDDAGLRIGPGDGADAGGLAQRRGLAVRRRYQPRRDRAPVGEAHEGAGGAALHVRHRQRRQVPEPRQLRRSCEKCLPQRAILDDPAERMIADVAVVVVQEEGRVVVGDADLEDGRRILRQLVPEPDRRQRLAGTIGDRRGAAVELRRDGGAGILAVDDGDVEAGVRHRNGEREPHQPAADDHELMMLGVIGRAVRRGHRATIHRARKCSSVPPSEKSVPMPRRATSSGSSPAPSEERASCAA